SLALESAQARADSVVFRHFQEALQVHGVPLIRAEEGESLGLLEPARCEILHPAPGYVPRTHADNNLSLVSLVSLEGRSFLLPGDLERDGLRDLLKKHPGFPRVDWLLAPHHGRATGEPALCARGFHPRFVVLSDGRDYPQARAQYLAEIPDAVVLSTSREGA